MADLFAVVRFTGAFVAAAFFAAVLVRLEGVFAEAGSVLLDLDDFGVVLDISFFREEKL